MEQLIVLSKILGLGFFITKFAPIQWILDLFYPSEKSNAFVILIYNILSLLTSCFSCCSFWVGTIFFGFWWGISAYVVAYFYIQLLAPIVEKIRLY
jgi:hypothetical protein